MEILCRSPVSYDDMILFSSHKKVGIISMSVHFTFHRYRQIHSTFVFDISVHILFNILCES